VSREYQTALAAIAILDERLRGNPSWLAEYELRPTDFRNFRENLEATYFIRLFAEFESALRDVWNSTGRGTEPRTADLLDALTSRREIPANVRNAAHGVRKYRNAIVHEESGQTPAVRFAEASRRLFRFLSYMPFDW
jgi:hypothetical protein